MKLTSFEIEEMLVMLDIRQDTVKDDAESATEFEAMPGALDALQVKLETKNFVFTTLELGWLKEEADSFLEKCQSAYDAEGNIGGAGRDLPKCKRFVEKINTEINNSKNFTGTNLYI